MTTKEPKVRTIEQGTVIDHIPAGRALQVYRILGEAGSDNTVLIAMKVESTKFGKKDVLKIENRFLTEDEANKISLIAPTATINIIRDFKVAEKRQVQLPERIDGLVKCPNPMCISNDERELVRGKFNKEGRNYRCHYCERSFAPGDLII